jgi:hypothetical protein
MTAKHQLRNGRKRHGAAALAPADCVKPDEVLRLRFVSQSGPAVRCCATGWLVASARQGSEAPTASLRIGISTFAAQLYFTTMHQPVYLWQIRFYFAIYLVEI